MTDLSNSTVNQTPVFKSILEDDWNQLGTIIQQHYFLRSKSNDYICVTGIMSEIDHSFIAKLLIPIGRLFGALVPYKGRDIAIDVHYNSKPENSNIYWDRVFKFEHGDFHFKSHMEPVKKNEVIEFVRFGVGTRLAVTAEEGALIFRDVGYLWRVFGIEIPIPGRWLLAVSYTHLTLPTKA